MVKLLCFMVIVSALIFSVNVFFFATVAYARGFSVSDAERACEQEVKDVKDYVKRVHAQKECFFKKVAEHRSAQVKEEGAKPAFKPLQRTSKPAAKASAEDAEEEE